ncbi:MAG: SCO family protein [Pseudomonadota bacterium]
MPKPIMIAGGGVAALGGLAFAVSAVIAPADRFADCRTVTVTEPLGTSFTLTDTTGRRVTDQEVFAKPTLLYFGYTFCPDVCPIDNGRNAAAVDLMAEDGVEAQPVFVTIDPERDDVELLAEYTAAFHDDMIGLTGSVEEIREVQAAYKSFSSRQGDDPEYYLVDHSTFTYLVLPGHGFVDLVSRSEDAQQVADRASCFVRNA